ncbi:hypothetical protein [Planobispora takensis]|uniref:Uncharacterized protein n=1 Tax=Planobispora takensis TaxID=1367882 RepID=A0A8J3T143_9ACTN|nr:hypothetical protein [Planobispora takensis]GII04409.1 hypothetical protein Pta02_64170 [Planobispora takensis]
MDPITWLILTAVAQLVIDVVIRLLHLAFATLTDWFVDKQAQLATDPNALAVTVAQSLRSGDFNIVQGIFDQRAGTFVGRPRRVRANSADRRVVQAHTGRPVTVWT